MRRRPSHLVTRSVLAVASVLVVLVAYLVWSLIGARAGLPGLEALQHIGDMHQATRLFDVRDQFAFTIFREQRIDVPLADISPNLVRAIVAVEDQRFYDHGGFDGFRILAAALVNIRHGRAAQGGSTITQQLARQVFLKPEKTIRRKLQELILANRIEKLYTKPQILELYLNKVYFGDGLYGAEAAARGYFGKHASELSLPEAALLAGLVKSPSSYAPTVNLSRAVTRRNLVLQAMLDSRVIDAAAWRSARNSKVQLRDTLRFQERHGQYFKEQVRRELVDRFGSDRVLQGGLRVFTTIDIPMQVAAEQVVAESLKSIEEKRKAIGARRPSAKKIPGMVDPPLQAALIALDPATGHVRALVGGRDFNESRFNRAIQARRQPGSAFKPFVFATALEEGYTPATLIKHLNTPVITPQGTWTPDDEHSSGSSMSLRTALRTSSNRAAVRLLQQVGIPQTVRYAKNMGVGNVPSVPSLALGSGEVTLQSLTAAYAGFANHGAVPRPTVIRRVEDQDGRVLYHAAEPSSVRAMSDTTAFLMSTMLADVVNFGTAAGARRLGFTLPAAGKTGTTNDVNDAWFVGFTPKLVAGVWVGFDQPHTILPNGFAGTIAVPVWAKFMRMATRDDAPEWFRPPAGVVTGRVCRVSGRLATEGCGEVEVTRDGQVAKRSMAYTEYFVRGTAPTTYCDRHATRSILGKIAAVFGGGGTKGSLPRPQDTERKSVVAPVAFGGQLENAVGPDRETKKGFWSRVFSSDGHDGRETGK
jgi:penicillin-binding protein 1A